RAAIGRGGSAALLIYRWRGRYRQIPRYLYHQGRLKDGLYILLLTGASGNAAALSGGVTLYIVTNIAFEGRAATAKNVLEEEKLRWKNIIMLIVDEISQVGGLILVARPESLAKYLVVYRLFLQFTTVVILYEQVRAAGCPRLRGFLRRLRNGE
ncbi:hypothetical protein MMYC01_209830, partial [Madurella mycetomatis]